MKNFRAILVGMILAVAALILFSGVLNPKSARTKALEIAKASASIVTERRGDEACKPVFFANDSDSTVLCFKLSGNLETAKEKVEAGIIAQDNLGKVSWTDAENKEGSTGFVMALNSDMWFAISLLHEETSTYGRIVYHSGHGVN